MRHNNEVSAAEEVWVYLRGLETGTQFTSRTVREAFPSISHPEVTGGAIAGFLHTLEHEKLIKPVLDGPNYVKEGRCFVFTTTAALKREIRQFRSRSEQSLTNRTRTETGLRVTKIQKIAPDKYVVEYEGARNKLGVLTTRLERLKEKLLDLTTELETLYGEQANLYLELNDKIEIDLIRIPSTVLVDHLKMRRARGLVDDSHLKELYDVSKSHTVLARKTKRK